jgi:hypothetical protein
MPIIQTTIGDVNLRNASAKISLFHYNKVNGTEQYISQAAKSANEVTQRGMAIFSPSVQGMLREIGGRCINATFSIAEGEVVKVFVKINPGYGRLEKFANFFIKAREHAAYRVVSINTVDAPGVLFKTAKLEGCFDMLSLEEALAEGVQVKSVFRRAYDPSRVATVITKNEVLQAERAASVKKEIVEVIDPLSGESTSVVKVKRRRAISI